MGAAEPAGSTAMDAIRAGIREGQILASNSGICVEERYPVGLNLGCGKVRWTGWVNVDIESGDVSCDLRKLTFPDNHADAVAAIHVFEHFYEWETLALLEEWRRVLKPGGKLILELPCMDKVFGYVVRCVELKEPMQPFMTLLPLYGDPKYASPAMCHKWGWFTKPIMARLEEAGFKQVTVCEPRYHFPFRDMRIEAIK